MQWTAATSGSTFAITDPSTGAVGIGAPDTHGILRGKTLATAAFTGWAPASGHTAPSTLILKDTSAVGLAVTFLAVNPS